MVRLGVISWDAHVFVHVERDDVLAVSCVTTRVLSLTGLLIWKDQAHLEADTAVIEHLHNSLVHRQRARASR